MNDQETKTMVQAAGRDLPTSTRDDVRSAIAGALAGAAPAQLAAVTPLPTRALGRRRAAVIVAGAAAAVIAIVVTLVVVSGSDHRVLTPATVDPPPPTAAPTTLPAPVTDPTATASSVDTTTPPTDPPPTVTVPATTDGPISPDSPKILLDVTDPQIVAADSLVSSNSIMRLQSDRRVFVLDVADRRASVFTLESTNNMSSIGVGLPDPSGFELTSGALGPDDVAYLSYRPAGTIDGPFVLIAVPLRGSKAGTLVGRWDTDWPCVETFCGDVRLTDDGIVVQGTFTSTNGGAPDSATPPVLAAYLNADGSPYAGSFHAPAQPGIEYGGHQLVLPDDYVNADQVPFGAVSTKVTVAERSWVVDVAGVHIVEGAYTTFQPQPDGTVLSRFDVSKDASKAGQSVLLDLQPDGSQVVYRLPDDLLVVDVASIDGELFAVAIIDDQYQYVRLAPHDAPASPTVVAQPIELPLPGIPPGSVHWLSATDGWAKPFTESHGGSTVPLLHTADGGVTWVSIDSGVPMTDDNATVRFADDANGYILTGDELYTTHTGGAPWTRIDLGGGAWSPVDVEVASGFVHVMAAGDNVSGSGATGITMFVSPVTIDDFVQSPVDIPFGAGPVLQGQIVLEGEHGFATYSDRGLIGGATLVDGAWVAWQTPCDGEDIIVSASASERVVLACATTGFAAPPYEQTLYRSDDGGASFTSITPIVGLSPQLQSVSFVGQPADGSIVAVQRRTDAPETIERSGDGGNSWTPVHEFGPDVAVIESFDIAGIGFGMLTNDGGGVASYDGGLTWSPIEPGTVVPS